MAKKEPSPPREPVVHTTARAARRNNDWWRGAVIYQVYPRSFQDEDGNGVGDLPGITLRLHYIRQLGVDALWISPFFKSPMKDYGYDVEDYTAVDPLFGTLADFDELLRKAHALGLKVLIDFVPSHTSDRHAWFQASRQDRTNDKADWYVWADPRADGMPPNNWLSVFGGLAWEWEPRRRQYYLHNFLKEQPDLNFHNPAVVAALLEQARFWLERGIDGFRVDAIDYGVHDPELRNNPPRHQGSAAPGAGAGVGSPYDMQYHFWNKARPQLVELFLKPLHALTERYDAKVLLGEISGDHALLRAAEYTNGGGLDIVYTFDLLTCPGRSDAIRAVVEELEAEIGDGWACWSFGNHDVPRPVSRFGGGSPPEGLRRLIPVLLGSLRGTISLYQGEELGLEEADLAFEDLHDPWGLAFWPNFKGRDGCRTPMPWHHDVPHGGFTEAERPWLPVPPAHLARAVDLQDRDPSSVLNTVRAFLNWRRERTALRTGSIEFLRGQEDADLLVFMRVNDADHLVCLFNLSDQARRWQAPGPLLDAGFLSEGAEVAAREVALPPWGFAFAHLE